MNPLIALLMGQQSGAEAVDTSMVDEEGNMVFTSPTNRPPPQPEQVTLQQQQVPDDFIMGNSTPVSMAREAEKDTELNSDRRGLFGAKGTLRDIIGILGDSIAVGAGGQASYMPHREKEKFADAMAGFSQGGDAQRSAIERGMRINPEATMEFLKQQQMSDANMGNLGIRKDEFNRDLTNDAMKRSGQMMAAAVATGDPAVIAQATQAIQALSTQTGIPVEKLLSGGDPRVVAGREATANQNLRLPQQERMVDVAEGNLAARRQQVQIAARNAKNAEERTRIYRDAVRERLRAGQVDEAMEFFELMDPDYGKDPKEATSPSGEKPRLTTKKPSVSNW